MAAVMLDDLLSALHDITFQAFLLTGWPRACPTAEQIAHYEEHRLADDMAFTHRLLGLLGMTDAEIVEASAKVTA